MKSRVFYCLFVCLALIVARVSAAQSATGPARRMNVLFLIIDDHKADLHDVFNAGSPVKTPSLQRLAARGTWFTHAYVDSPACCPSRTAFLTGVHTTRSGVYYNSQAYRRASTWISRAQTLPGNFLRHGYLVAGYGKIAHNRYLEDDAGDYTPGHYRMFNRAGHVTHTDAALLAHILPGTRVDYWHESWSFGVLPDDWDRDEPTKLQQDTEFANHTIGVVRRSHDRPFFVTCGFWRPHVAWTVPKRYFDRFPLESITIPEGYLPDDLEDLPKPARWLATHRGEHDYIVKHGLWKKTLQAKYAAIAYIDEQIGRVLDALDGGPNRENTIVVLAADNGWHTGEKNHWSKFYLSDLACRVVFSVAVPGMRPQVCAAPVSLIDVYPTLNALCGLEPPSTHDLDGVDLSAVLRGSATTRGKPVLSTYGRGNHSLRDDRFRYTRYRDGTEELYDHRYDPHEWTNLATDPRFAQVRERLSAHLPAGDAPDVEYASDRDRETDGNRWSEAAFR